MANGKINILSFMPWQFPHKLSCGINKNLKKKNQQFSNSLPLTLSVSLSLWSNSYSLFLFYAQPPWQHDWNLLSEFLQHHYYSLPLPTVITPVVAKSKPSFVTSHSLTLTRFLSSIYQDRSSKPLSVFELCISGI